MQAALPAITRSALQRVGISSIVHRAYMVTRAFAVQTMVATLIRWCAEVPVRAPVMYAAAPCGHTLSPAQRRFIEAYRSCCFVDDIQHRLKQQAAASCYFRKSRGMHNSECWTQAWCTANHGSETQESMHCAPWTLVGLLVELASLAHCVREARMRANMTPQAAGKHQEQLCLAGLRAFTSLACCNACPLEASQCRQARMLAPLMQHAVP